MTVAQARERLQKLAAERDEILSGIKEFHCDPGGLYPQEYWRLREQLVLKDESINEVRDWYLVGTLERLETDNHTVALSTRRLEQFTFALTFVTILLLGTAIATMLFQFQSNRAATVIAVVADAAAIMILIITRNRLRPLQDKIRSFN